MSGVAARPRVVLVRPWTDAQAGGGCCGGGVRDGVAPLPGPGHRHEPRPDEVGTVWRALRESLPWVDVQVVDVANTAWLLPATFRTVRRQQGLLAGLRAATRATTAGAVLLCGERVGDLTELGPQGVVDAVRERLESRSPASM